MANGAISRIDSKRQNSSWWYFPFPVSALHVLFPRFAELKHSRFMENPHNLPEYHSVWFNESMRRIDIVDVFPIRWKYHQSQQQLLGICIKYHVCDLSSSALWFPWWRHQMEIFSALLALYAGNSPVNGEFPAQRPVTRSFNVFFDLRLNKR